MGDGIAQSAIDATGSAAGLEGYAFALRRRRSRHPAPGGVAPSPTSRKRPSGDTKTFKPLVEGAKRQGRFLDRSETIRAKSISRMILLAQFSCEPPCQSQFAHSRSMALIQFWLIFLSRGDCPISRDNNISQSRMRRKERQRRDCDWQGRLKKNKARSGNERASGNERFSASGE